MNSCVWNVARTLGAATQLMNQHTGVKQVLNHSVRSHSIHLNSGKLPQTSRQMAVAWQQQLAGNDRRSVIGSEPGSGGRPSPSLWPAAPPPSHSLRRLSH